MYFRSESEKNMKRADAQCKVMRATDDFNHYIELATKNYSEWTIMKAMEEMCRIAIIYRNEIFDDYYNAELKAKWFEWRDAVVALCGKENYKRLYNRAAESYFEG